MKQIITLTIILLMNLSVISQCSYSSSVVIKGDTYTSFNCELTLSSGIKIDNILSDHFGTPNNKKGYTLNDGKIIIEVKKKKNTYYIKIKELGASGQFEDNELKEVVNEIKEI